MKKMEAMMELLTEEIEGFNKSIKKLEGLSENFKDIKVKADTSNIEYYMNDFLRKQEQTMSSYKENTAVMSQALKSARITPDWMATLFCIVVSVQILSLSYFAHHFIRFEIQKEKAFLHGRKEGMFELREYFNDHPIIYKDFQKWARKQDSVPNRE